MTDESKQDIPGPKRDLSIDVEELRRKLGPVKVALIDLWIREVNGPLNTAIQGCVRPDSAILDVGCSRGDPDLPALNTGRFVVGCDVDLLGLRANTVDDAVAMAPAAALPFADACFDVVVAKWVAEHLEDPARDFAEFHRVLRPGGALVLLTPNAHSFFTLASRLTPHRVKQLLKGNMFGIHEEDTFRTWYRANTRRTLRGLTAEAGFAEERVDLIPGMWTFFIFNGPLARLVRRIEHVQAKIPGLHAATAYLVGVWRKP